MTEQDLFLLKIYTLLSPALVVLAAVAAIWIGDWMDRREQRRHPAE
jgi:hypothetical protein